MRVEYNSVVGTSVPVSLSHGSIRDIPTRNILFTGSVVWEVKVGKESYFRFESHHKSQETLDRGWTGRSVYETISDSRYSHRLYRTSGDVGVLSRTGLGVVDELFITIYLRTCVLTYTRTNTVNQVVSQTCIFHVSY